MYRMLSVDNLSWNLAIIPTDGHWQAVEGADEEQGHGDRRWIPPDLKLKLSTTKTMSAAFHLNSKEAKRELKANFNNETLPFCSEPQHLGVTLNRSLTYRRHLESLRKKLTSCVALLRWFAGSGWGAGATTFWTATLALMHSTAEYYTPVWCRSAHTRLVDPAINDALRIVTSCLRPTPANNLPILTGIQPAVLRRMEPHCLSVSSTSCHGAWTSALLSAHPPSSANARRLKPRLAPAAQQLISSSDNTNIRAAQWADHQWNAEWVDNPTRLRIFIPDTPGVTLPRRAWVRLNRLHTGVGRFRSCLYKWVMSSSAACECDAEEQTVGHVVLQCSIHRPPHELHGLTFPDDETTGWLFNTCSEI